MWDDHRRLNRVSSVLQLSFVVLTMYALIIFTMRLPVFPLRDVQIQGEVSHTSQEQIGALLQTHFKGNFFTFDLEGLREAFSLLPWVRSASVRRIWPDRLEVLLEEHAVMARWGERALVNTYGEVYEAASDRRLPLFIGPEGSSHEMTERFADFNQILSPLKREVMELHLSERRAWSVKLDDGMVLELGREHFRDRLARFVSVYPRAIATLSVPPKRVDLRYQNGFALHGARGKAGVVGKDGVHVAVGADGSLAAAH